MPAGPCHIREISDPSELESLRLAWKSLLANTREAEFLQSLDWLQVYCEHFGAKEQLRVLAVSHAGQTLGILPLVVAREPTRMGSLRVLTYPVREWGPFYGPIGPNPTATLA